MCSLPIVCLFFGLGAVPGQAPANAAGAFRAPEHVTVFRCLFDEKADRNFDHWPDGWTRQTGPAYPHYVRVGISREPSPAGDCCLRIDLDGGAAAAYSPPIPVSGQFSYILEGWIKTEGLKHDRAWVSLGLQDAEGRRLERFVSAKLQQTSGWQQVRIGPIDVSRAEIQQAVVGVHLEPQGSADLRGSARFDDLRLWRLPRLRLETTRREAIFTDPKAVAIVCTVSGFAAADPPLQFVLEGPLGETIARDRTILKGRVTQSGPVLVEQVITQRPLRRGEVRWQPPLSGPGFYRVRATLGPPEQPITSRQLTLVVLPSEVSGGPGVFGWSLPGGEKPLPLERLETLLGQAGVGWVKYPLWFDPQLDPPALERLLRFCEGLATRGIEVVGLLDQPPESVRRKVSSRNLSAAQLFGLEPKVWYPSLEAVLGQMATQVRWWQLGRDEDTSFVADPSRVEKLARVKQHLDRIGQDVSLGFGWDWRLPLPEDPSTPLWRFLSLSSGEPLSARQLAEHLQAPAPKASARFVVLRPLDRRHKVAERVADLLQRMMIARIYQADAVFCPDPFDPQCGLMNPDGTPGELFLPWRTAALLLGNAEHLGQVRLPGGSSNELFAQNDQAVMVVWRRQPGHEAMALGPQARVLDPWGRRVLVRQEGHRQVFPVGPLPVFVTGMNPAMLLWRLDCRIEKQQIPSVFGRPHGNVLHLVNRFPQEATGTARFMGPTGWQFRPAQFRFRIAPGQTFEQPFEIVLPYYADTGPQPLEVDFEVRAGEKFHFSVFRQIEVGLGGVRLEASTRLNDQGELEVEQRLINSQTEPVSFRCQLYVPDRRSLGTQVLGLGQDEHVHVYRLPDGEQLLGKTLWLRAVEVGGARTLSRRFVATAAAEKLSAPDRWKSSQSGRAGSPSTPPAPLAGNGS